MKVKNKLFFSLLFLFAVIIVLAAMGIRYLQWLADDSAAIMKDNNRTLTYMRNIDDAISQIEYATLQERLVKKRLDKEIKILFDNLSLQKKNITEPGEKELVNKLESNINMLADIYARPASIAVNQAIIEILPVIQEIRTQIGSIYLINERSMLRKSERAKATAERAMVFMAALGVASVVIGLIFIIWLPLYISKPLSTFNKAVMQIARGNYKINIPKRSKDEYGQLADSFNTMAAKLDEYEHSNLSKLLKEQKRLNSVINQMNEAILGLDESKRIIFANKRMLEILGMEKQQIINQYATDLAENNELMSNLISELMIPFRPDEERSFKQVEVVDGGNVKQFAKNIVDVVIEPTGENRTILIGHVIILSDITAYAERDKARTHFMATISHELKTPVAAIQMSAMLLRNVKTGNLTDEQLELISTIESNNSRITHTINEILDLSQIESGTIDLTIHEVNVEEIIQRTLDGVKIFLKDKGIKIEKEVQQPDALIKVDPHKTVWILNNFMMNAIRYSSNNSIVKVAVEQEGSFIKISVTDKGPGIAPGDQKKIFDKFTRLDKSMSGTGLGLAISKEFIEAMGGSIDVHSEEGSGATFWIRCVKV